MNANRLTALLRGLLPGRTTALAGLLVGLVLLWNGTQSFQGDVLGFYRIGELLPSSPYLAPSSQILAAGEVGYDGQLFLTIALDPLLRHPASRAALDNPRYRYRRMLFPVLGYALALGHRSAIPYALVLLNGLCLVALTVLARRLFVRAQRPAAWSLCLLLIPGYWSALLLTTADLLAALLLTTALTAFLEQRYRLLAACLALAGLTHETMLATIGALALPLLGRRQFRAVGWLALGSLPVLAWNAFVIWYLPTSGSTSGLLENFSWPGQGLAAKLGAIASGPFNAKWAYDAAAWVLLSLSLLRLTWLASTRAALHFLAPSAWVYLVLFFTSRMQIHGYHLDFLRVFAPGLLLLALTARRPASARWTGISMAAWGLCSLAFLLAYSTGRI